MNLPQDRKNRLILYFLGYWIFFLLLLVVDARGWLRKIGLQDVGVKRTLKESALARGMFADVGGLASLVAAWIMWGNRLPMLLKIPFALGTLILGSTFAIPFAILYLLIGNLHKD